MHDQHSLGWPGRRAGLARAAALGLALMTLALAADLASAAVDRSATDWQVAEIYMATVGYAPDNEGLQYWVEQIDTDPATWNPTAVAQSFFDQPLIERQYPADQAPEDFIASLYENIFGRAPDAEGEAYWRGELGSGSIQRNQMIVALINGGWASTDPVASADMTRFGHLVEVSLAFAEAQAQRGIVYSALTEVRQNALRRAGALALAGVTSDTATRDAALTRIPALLDAVTATGPSRVPVRWFVQLDAASSDSFGDCRFSTTDGTATGTECIASDSGDILNPFGLYQLDDERWVYQYDYALYRTDGTAAGTEIIMDRDTAIDVGFYLDTAVILSASQIVFNSHYSSALDMEPFLFDLATNTISLIEDINPVGSSNPRESNGEPKQLTSLGNGKAVFLAYTPDGDDSEPWVTDGTEAGTFQLKDISPIDHEGDWWYQFTPLGDGKMLFNADDGVNGFSPWVTDGTREGTKILKSGTEIFPDDDHFDLYFHSFGNGTGLFLADSRVANTLYFTDGTPAGTKAIFSGEIADTVDPSHSVIFSEPCAGMVFFREYGGVSRDSLWVTDGTAIGTSRLAENLYFIPERVACLGDGRAVFWARDSFFSADDSGHGGELWVTDGTSAGTHLIKDIYPGLNSAGFTGKIFSFGNGTALFCATYPYAPDGELWITDGTEAGTQPFKEVDAELAEAWREQCGSDAPVLTPYRYR